MLTRLLNKQNFGENFYLLATTAYPGFYKLVVLFLIEFLFAREVLSSYLNDVFIVYIFGFLTIFNWSTFIIAEMPKLPKAKQPLFFGKIYWASNLVMALAILILLFLAKLKLIENFYGAAMFLFSYSLYHLWRFFFLASKLYKTLFFADTANLFLSLLALLFSFYFSWNILITQSFATVLVPIAVQLLGIRQPKFYWNFKFWLNFDWRIFKKSFTFSLINLSTGGIALFFTPLSHHLLDAATTTIIGFTTNIAAFVLLVPKALSRHFIPKLIASYRSLLGKPREVFQSYVKYNNMVVSITIIIGFLGALIFSFFSSSNMTIFLLIFGLIYSNKLLSQLALPGSNFIVVLKKYDELLRINLLMFSLYIVGFLLIYNLVSDGLVILTCSIGMQILSNMYRSFYLNKVCLVS